MFIRLPIECSTIIDYDSRLELTIDNLLTSTTLELTFTIVKRLKD